jgi:hypothetical protein
VSDLKRIPLTGSVEEKVAWARAGHLSWDGFLTRDGEISGLLAGLEREIEASRKAMRAGGVMLACRACEETEGGSCCGAGIERKYDGYLLLINLMLGVELPEERLEPNSCFFQGAEGCRLKARHVICINYLCKKVTDQVEPEDLSLLREAEGAELHTLFRLHERIKKLLREMSLR